MSNDLDQGGTARQWVRVNLGPTVGWVMMTILNRITIITAGTTNIPIGTAEVLVNVAGSVTVQLPTSIPPTGVPTGLLNLPIVITDSGGQADTFPITILPFGSELLIGMASLTLSSRFGSYNLVPIPTGGWNQQ